MTNRSYDRGQKAYPTQPRDPLMSALAYLKLTIHRALRDDTGPTVSNVLLEDVSEALDEAQRLMRIRQKEYRERLAWEATEF